MEGPDPLTNSTGDSPELRLRLPHLQLDAEHVKYVWSGQGKTGLDELSHWEEEPGDFTDPPWYLDQEMIKALQNSVDPEEAIP